MPKIHTDEELLQAVEVRNRHCSNRAAAKELGVNEHTIANRLWRAAERGLDGSVPKPMPPGYRVGGASTLYKKTEEGWDEKLVWVKSKAEDADREKLIETLKSTFESYKGKADPIAPPKTTYKNLLTVYPIADQHVGLLAWGQETGEDYDLEIGSKRLLYCAAKLISRTPPSDEAIILNLGDWQHSDDGRNETPQSGNRLDVDGRYQKVLSTGIRLMMDVIELALQKHKKVTVRNLPGNHDPHSSVALTVALDAFYHNEPRVTIDTDPSEFFFRRFGQTLIGANHGHRMKPADMAMTLAVRCREDWGLAKYKHFMFGHIHNITAKEVAGVLVESFRTLAGKDGWSHAKGFTSGQSLTSITYDIEGGEDERHMVNV